MKAKLDVVYFEERYDRYNEEHWVRVEIRCWHGPMAKYKDYVLDAKVIVDGDLVVDKREILNEYTRAADLQRHGIRVFDELLLGHPVLSPEANNGLGSGTC